MFVWIPDLESDSFSCKHGLFSSPSISCFKCQSINKIQPTGNKGLPPLIKTLGFSKASKNFPSASLRNPFIHESREASAPSGAYSGQTNIHFIQQLFLLKILQHGNKRLILFTNSSTPQERARIFPPLRSGTLSFTKAGRRPLPGEQFRTRQASILSNRFFIKFIP